MQISARTVAKVILTATAVVAGLYLLWLIRGVILILFVSIFLAVALGPAVDFYERRLHLRRIAAIAATYFTLLLGLTLIGFLVVPPIVDETARFVENVPEYVDDVGNNKQIRELDDKYDLTPKLREEAAKLPERFGDAATTLQSIVVGIFSAVLTIVTVLVLAFFLLLDGRRVFDWIVRELGPERGPRVRAVAEQIYQSVGEYVLGALTIAIIAGVTTYLFLSLIGVPFAVPLALLMAFLDLIPLVGATIAGVAIGIVAAISDFPSDLIAWAVFLIVYQQIENNLFQPMIHRRTVSLHPLLVIVAILVGATLLGIVGALIAIPIAGAIQIVVKDWWSHRKALEAAFVVAGDEPTGPGGLPPG